jgi:hypothetical protein
MSAGEDPRRADGNSLISEASAHADRREVPRYAFRRAVLFRRRGALPSPGVLLNISERGALVQVEKPTESDLIPWPLFLRHGDELWLYKVIKDPLACWVVAVERDHVRLRLFTDAEVLPELRALISKLDLEPSPEGRLPAAGSSAKVEADRVR